MNYLLWFVKQTKINNSENRYACTISALTTHIYIMYISGTGNVPDVMFERVYLPQKYQQGS